MKQNCPVPAFLSKLWTLLEEESTNDLICWTQDGFSFVVVDELRFSKEVLPLYFKHSNMTSFVRQLNMYGFHKVVHIDSGLVRDAVNPQSVEFQHEYFQRSQAHLLSLIRRKVSVSRVNDDAGPMSQVMVEVSQVRRWYDSSHVQLLALCRDNQTLWREVDALRQKYQHQHQVIRKIIRFIATTVQSNTIKSIKRKLPMIDSSGDLSPAPKLRRSASVQSSYMDSRDGVYSNRVIFSDITHMLQPNSNLKSSVSVSLEVPSAFVDDFYTSSYTSPPKEASNGFCHVPPGSTGFSSKPKEMPTVFTDVPFASPNITSQPVDVSSMFRDVPCLSSTVPSLSKDIPPMFSEVPLVSSRSTQLSTEPPSEITDVPHEVASVPAVVTDFVSMFSEVLSASTDVPTLSTELPLLFSEVPSAVPSDPPVPAEILSVFPEVPSGSTGAPLESVEQALSLLIQPETLNPTDSHAKRCEDDPLDLIDSSLAAISSSLAPSHSVDLFSEFLDPVEDAADHTASSLQIAERKPEAQLREETPLLTQTGLCGDDDDDDDDEDGGVGSDILPSLLQLAREASALSMPTSVPPHDL